MRVLDVACARAIWPYGGALGAQVTRYRISRRTCSSRRGKRAATEGVAATFEEGDAEQLPYPDASFRSGLTMFGAMLPPRPSGFVRALPGVPSRGTIADGELDAGQDRRQDVSNWAADTLRYRRASRRLRCGVTKSEFGAAWRGCFADRDDAANRHVRLSIPAGRGVEHFRSYSGRCSRFSKLDEAGQKAFSVDLENLWREHNKGEGIARSCKASYLEVIGAAL